MAATFKCTYPKCGKVFKRRDYLLRHSANHDSVKPFHCEVCHMAFARKDLVGKHRKSKAHRRRCADSQQPPLFVNSFVGSAAFQEHKEPPLFWDLKMDSTFARSEFINLMNMHDQCGFFFDTVKTPSPGEPAVSPRALATSPRSDPTQTKLVDDENYQWDMVLPVALQQRVVELVCGELLKDATARDHFSASELDTYLDNYYTFFDPIYPIVHKQIFVMDEDPRLLALLTVAVLTIGMTFTDAPKDQMYSAEYRMATQIHDTLRTQLFMEINRYQNMGDIPLPLLETAVLADFFNLYLGTKAQSRSSNLFHPLVMSLLQEMDLFVTWEEPAIAHEKTLSRAQWHAWIRFESIKRVALFGYMLDAQRSFFHAKNPCISLFEIQLELPYADRVWYAKDPAEFLRFYVLQPRDLRVRDSRMCKDDRPYVIDSKDMMSNGLLIPNVKGEGRWPNFLWSVRRLMQRYKSTQKEFQRDCFSQFSRYIMLHGVLSLVRELRNLSVFDLDNQKERLAMMGSKIEQSFFSWQRYLNKHLIDVNAESFSNPADQMMNKYTPSPSLWSNLIMFKIGLLGLYCNFDILLEYRHSMRKSENQRRQDSLLGVQSPERTKFYEMGIAKSRMMVASWASSKSGFHSNAEACNILNNFFNSEELLSTLPHAPFSLYISVLVCWFYQTQRVDDVSSLQHFDIVSQRAEIEQNALDYVSEYVETDEENARSEVHPSVKALVLHSITVLERSSRWENSNLYVDDLCSLLDVQ